MNKFSQNSSADKLDKIIGQALTTIDLEVTSLSKLAEKFRQNPQSLQQAINIIVETINFKGNIIVTGMGKSGHIAQKISATFASTGSPSFYLHPAEALHGDLGRISANDSVLAISYSGKSQEILAILPSIKRFAKNLIVICGDKNSPLAQAANVLLDGNVEKEACPHNLAPTCSTTVQLAIGDALAIGALVAQDFTAEDFYKFHPGGALGKKLITVAEIMHIDKDLPTVSDSATISETVYEITRGGIGMSAVLDDKEKLIGLFTDGDLRRLIEKSSASSANFNINQTIATVMTKNPKTIGINSLAAEALAILSQSKINQLLVVDGDKLVGAIGTHDLLRNNII